MIILHEYLNRVPYILFFLKIFSIFSVVVYVDLHVKHIRFLQMLPSDRSLESTTLLSDPQTGHIFAPKNSFSTIPPSSSLQPL